MLNKKLLGASSGLPQDPNFENVTLLLNGDGTNGAQNNTFLDSSTNNFTITRNGNTTQGSFSPYGNLWSNYFDGTGDNLTFPSGAAFQFGTGDFTIESWVFLTSAPATQYIIDARTTGQIGTWAFGWGLATSGRLGFFNGSTTLEEASTSVTANTWAHCVVSRSGTTLSIFVNGTRVATATNSTNFSISPATSYIGSQYLASAYMTGYLSNVRTVKGTAVYDPTQTTLTVPTAPLTAITNTSLLTCQSNRFLDASSNNFTITRNGDVSVQRFSPFEPTAPYSTSVIGGSGYFDNDGDSLTASATSLPTGSSAYTIEAWVYTTVAERNEIVNWGTNTTGQTNALRINADGSITVYWWFNDLSTGSVLNPNAWNHIVSQYDGTTRKIFLNGTQIASDTPTAPNVTGTNITVGTIGTEWYRGYISDLRISNVALYSGTSYTVPTAPLPTISSTRFLLGTRNAGIPDLAMQNNLETVGNAQVSTSVKKYGTGSLAFDGTGDYLVLPNSSLFELGTGNFTIEAWVWIDSTVNPGRPDNNKSVTIFSTGSSSSNDCSFAITGNTTSAGLGFELYQVTPGIALNVSATVGTNSWAHIAFVRTGTTIYVFVNGTRYTLGTTSVAIGSSVSPKIGIANSSGYTNQFKGYIDDLRITKGLARYTTTFTPPASALPTY
jgi:hypothetical protein